MVTPPYLPFLDPIGGGYAGFVILTSWCIRERASILCEVQESDRAPGAYLFILLFFFLFSFFLWTKLGLFLLFPFAFIFTSLITHICFSVIENECSSQLRQDLASL